MSAFEGKVALVTGGGRGVGAACALALAERGADCALIDAPSGLTTPVYPLTTCDELAATAERVRALGRRSVELPVDVRDGTAVGAAVEELESIHLLVVTAAIRTVASIEALTDAEWQETIDVNLHGVYNALRTVVPRMVADGDGRVVVVVGDEGRRGAPRLSHGAAAAWSAIGLAKSVAIEVADAGVAINVVCTGPLDTASFNHPASWAQAARTPEADAEEARHALRVRHPRSEAFVPAERVVESVLFLLGQAGEELTGSVLDVSMGVAALNSC